MIKLPPTRRETTAAFGSIAKLFMTAGVELGNMFGMPALKIDGKGFAGIFGDDLVFKLDGKSHARAIALKGAKLFDPSGSGRGMKEWVVIPAAHHLEWESFARDALAYVKTTEAKPAKAISDAPPAEGRRTTPPPRKSISPFEKKRSIMPENSHASPSKSPPPASQNKVPAATTSSPSHSSQNKIPATSAPASQNKVPAATPAASSQQKNPAASGSKANEPKQSDPKSPQKKPAPATSPEPRPATRLPPHLQKIRPL